MGGVQFKATMMRKFGEAAKSKGEKTGLWCYQQKQTHFDIHALLSARCHDALSTGSLFCFFYYNSCKMLVKTHL